jgi:hypothetical protein
MAEKAYHGPPSIETGRDFKDLHLAGRQIAARLLSPARRV